MTTGDEASENKRLLRVLDALPDLLALARAQARTEGHTLIYPRQDALREERRRQGQAFMWSMPYRHLYRCRVCGVEHTEVRHELENPRLPAGAPGHRAETSASALHAAREHGCALREEVRVLLIGVAQGDR